MILKGDTPKTLAQQFFKDEVVQYLEAVEWDRDHPEQAESKESKFFIILFRKRTSSHCVLIRLGISGSRGRFQWRFGAHQIACRARSHKHKRKR